MDFQIWTFYLDQILIYCALALSLNLLLGYAGQVSVAHAAFAAIGGYTVGYMMTIHGWGFIHSALFGMALASGRACWSLPAMKLSVEYLILLTLARRRSSSAFFTTIKDPGTYGIISIRTSRSSAGTWSGSRTGSYPPLA